MIYYVIYFIVLHEAYYRVYIKPCQQMVDDYYSLKITPIENQPVELSEAQSSTGDKLYKLMKEQWVQDIIYVKGEIWHRGAIKGVLAYENIETLDDGYYTNIGNTKIKLCDSSGIHHTQEHVVGVGRAGEFNPFIIARCIQQWDRGIKDLHHSCRIGYNHGVDIVGEPDYIRYTIYPRYIHSKLIGLDKH